MNKIINVGKELEDALGIDYCSDFNLYVPDRDMEYEYESNEGVYATLDGFYTHCRDTLLLEFSQRKGDFKKMFYLTFPESSPYGKISRFLNDFQKTAHILDKDQCKIYKTDVMGLVCIKTTDFWRSSIVRFSLLSALIRCSFFYTKSISYAFRSSGYFNSHSMVALKRFMDGNTCIKYKPDGSVYDGYVDFPGWQDYFNNLKKNDINKILVRKTA